MSDKLATNEQFRTLAEIGRHTAEFNSSRLYREAVAALIDCEQAQAAIVAMTGLSPEECRAAWTAWDGDLYALRYGLAVGDLRIVNGEVVEHHQPEPTFDDLFAASLRLMPPWRRPFARLSRAWWAVWCRLRSTPYLRARIGLCKIRYTLARAEELGFLTRQRSDALLTLAEGAARELRRHRRLWRWARRKLGLATGS